MEITITKPRTISSTPAETSQTELTRGTTSADLSLTPYRRSNRALWGLEHVVVGLETSFFDEPANEFRGSTWTTPRLAPRYPVLLYKKEWIIIEKLLRAQEELQEVPENVFKMIVPFPCWEENLVEKIGTEEKLHVTQLITLQLHLILMYCRRFPVTPGFLYNDLLRLHQGNIEVLLFIRFARKYDFSIDAIRLMHGEPPYKKRHFRHLYREEEIEALFHLLRTKLVDLKLDEVEYALFQAIAFFKDCTDIEQPLMVFMHQQYYGRLLCQWMGYARFFQLIEVHREMCSIQDKIKAYSICS